MKLKLRKIARITSLSTHLLQVLSLSRFGIMGIIFFCSIMLHAKAATFRFSIQTDPESLDPAHASLTLNSYLLNALYAPLYRWQGGILEPYGLTACTETTPLVIDCTLRPDWRWSDGKTVEGQEIIRGWTRLNQGPSTRRGHFTNIRNLEALDKRRLRFTLKEKDTDFFYRLLDPALSPARADIPMDGKVSTGPYFLTSKEPGRLRLSTNPYFFISAKRPKLEVLVVENDDTALRLFEKGQLNFLRRLTAENIPQFSKHPGLRQLPLARFDYIGISGELEKSQKMRQALVAGVQGAFPAFQKLFMSLGTPGCFSLPAQLSNGAMCFSHLKAVVGLPAPTKSVLPLYYSTQGGHDIERGMTLFQAEWKKSGWNIELRPLETTQLYALVQNPKTRPALFRRGLPLDRPTCLAAAELFTTDHPDNLIGLKDAKYDDLVKKLRERTTTENCRQVLKHLLTTQRIIPMGEIYFHQVSDQKFDNIFINSLNQLDLGRLSPLSNNQ